MPHPPSPLSFSFSPGEKPKGIFVIISWQKAPADKGEMEGGGVNTCKQLNVFGIKQASGYSGTFYELVEFLKR